MRTIQMLIAVIAVSVVMTALPTICFAQDQTSVPNHVHYKEPKQQTVSPTGAIAPRLQKLGTHTFPVSTRNSQAQLFMNQGLNLSYAFN
ncbi:MAG: hypothetical protein ABI923_08700, partial [bacterium]